MTIAGYYKCILLIALAGSMPLFATAQSLPTKQEISLRAPDNIKIDGKTTEWGDKFQAYNVASRVFYTVSNDDNNLYLTAKMKDTYGNYKVTHGGIIFKINNISVTFPANANKYEKAKDDMQTNATTRYKWFANMKSVNNKKIDSLVALTNKQINSLFRVIQISGIKSIAEPLISKYNTSGIQVAIMFTGHMEYVYELAIPLKYLGVSINNGEKFGYNITINPFATIAVPGIPGPPTVGDLTKVDPDLLYTYFPTDFSGDYTLAKK